MDGVRNFCRKSALGMEYIYHFKDQVKLMVGIYTTSWRRNCYCYFQVVMHLDS